MTMPSIGGSASSNPNVKGPEAFDEHTEKKPTDHQITSHLHRSLKAAAIDFNTSSTSSPSSSPLHLIVIYIQFLIGGIVCLIIYLFAIYYTMFNIIYSIISSLGL
jgi:hypothetical protein